MDGRVQRHRQQTLAKFAEASADGWGGGVDKSSIQPVRNKKGQKSAFSRVSVDNFVDILRRSVRAGAGCGAILGC